jgi:septal ring factor EnvC (AmiA/AmiB activator)
MGAGIVGGYNGEGMATSQDIVEWVLAAGAGGLLARLVDWFLTRRQRKVNGVVRLGEGWQSLVSEIQEERQTLLKQVAALRGRMKALEERVAHLEQENKRLAAENAELRTELGCT